MFKAPILRMATMLSASSAAVPFTSGFYKSIGGSKAEAFERMERFAQVD
jgi:hypothetical protein